MLSGVPVRASKPGGMKRRYSFSQAGVSRSGSTLTKTARRSPPIAVRTLPMLPVVAGQTSGHCVYPKNTRTGRPRRDARENGRASASTSSIGGAGRTSPTRNRSTPGEAVAGAVPGAATTVIPTSTPSVTTAATARLATCRANLDELLACGAPGGWTRTAGWDVISGLADLGPDGDHAGLLEGQLQLDRVAHLGGRGHAHQHDVVTARLELDRR